MACFILIIALLVWLDHSNIPKTSQPPAAEKVLSLYHEKIFSVKNVIDGDTLDVNYPDGKYQTTRIRLLGIDTPETHFSQTGQMYFGKEASDFTREASLGKKVKVILNTVGKTRDRYGRLLAYIELPNGEILNEKLITEGLAYADTRFEHPRYERYLRLEKIAGDANLGLWKNLTREKAPEWVRKNRAKIFK
ncbi:MAG: thermonuclease family protein [Anaerohalosphaeraceae bacterium]|nr:thermonuclease family protein [Anaerohalosphaeraceae bacterium]